MTPRKMPMMLIVVPPITANNTFSDTSALRFVQDLLVLCSNLIRSKHLWCLLSGTGLMAKNRQNVTLTGPGA